MIDKAIAIMRAIDETLPDHDGVKWFNRLYLRVTVSVGGAVLGAEFRDPAFLSKLDVVFANLYFSALTSGLSNIETAPAAWRPLLRVRYTQGIARIQFALAGMNAHINRDLPDGIVQSFRALGGNPITDRTREQDFERVNDLLERVEHQVKPSSPLVRSRSSIAWAARSTMPWPCGTFERRAAPRGRMPRFYGDSAMFHSCVIDSSASCDSLVGMTSRGLLLPVRS